MKDLFGNDSSPPALIGRKRLAERLHANLLAVYSSVENKCGKCRHLCVKRGSSNWYKCSKATLTGGLSTDWKCKWQACGLFEELIEKVETKEKG